MKPVAPVRASARDAAWRYAAPAAPAEPPGCVLVVDDDDEERETVAQALAVDGHRVLPAGDADAAWALLAAGDVDLVVLDINLPGTMNGLQVLHRLRAEGRSVPVIMLTGWSSEMNRVIGFQLGADDYVVKPFSPRELAARVTAVLRRATAPDAAPRSRLTRGSLTVDAGRREASAAGRRLRLSRREFDLLAHLTLRSPQVATYDELLRAVWHGSTGTTATVNEHVRRLRRALHDAAPHGPTITNVRGVGYVLDA